MPASPTGGELREELRSDATTITDTAKDRVHSEVDARKATAAEQAKSLSSALESAAGELQDSPDWLRSLFQQGAQTIQRFADTIEQKDSRELTREVKQMARENPGTFLGACAMAGFAAARVLKAGVEDTSGSGSGAATAEANRLYDPYQPQPSAPTGTAFAGMDDPERSAQPAYAGEM